MEAFTHGEMGSLEKTQENKDKSKEGFFLITKNRKITGFFIEKKEPIKNALIVFCLGAFENWIKVAQRANKIKRFLKRLAKNLDKIVERKPKRP